MGRGSGTTRKSTKSNPNGLRGSNGVEIYVGRGKNKEVIARGDEAGELYLMVLQGRKHEFSSTPEGFFLTIDADTQADRVLQKQGWTLLNNGVSFEDGTGKVDYYFKPKQGGKK